MALNFPSSPSIGDIYTDTTSGFSYEWDGTVWKSYTPASASNIKILDDISGSFDGLTQTFALTVSSFALSPASAQQLRIVLGGVVQTPVTDYTVSGSNITFTTAPDAALDFSGVSLGPAVAITYANDGNIYVRNTYVGAGATGPFAFPEGYTVGYLDVYRNGVRLSSGTDFVGTSGTNFFLTEAAEVDDEIEAIGYSVTALVQASSNLDNLNVTGITTTGRLQVTTNANVVGIVTAASFVGNLTGNVTGNADTATTAGYATTAGIATVAQGLTGTPNLNVGVVTATSFFGDGSGLTGAGSTVSDDTSTNSTFYPLFTATTTGTVTDSKVSTTKLSFNPSSGRLSTSQLFGSKIINYSEQVNALGNTGASKTITISDGSFVTATLDQSTVFTFSSPGSSDSYGFTLLLTNGAGGPFTITWPASVKWPSNITPVRTTADGKSDIWTFNTIDNGVTWYGYIAVYDFS